MPQAKRTMKPWSVPICLLLAGLALLGILSSIDPATAAAEITVSATNGLSCAGTRYKQELNCSAGEFTTTVNISSQSGGPTSCVAGEYLIMGGSITLKDTNADRYNIGFFTGEDGNNPWEVSTGLCSVATFPTSLDPPWFDSNNPSIATDTCGDYRDGEESSPIIQNLRVLCQPDAAGNLVIPYTLVYSQNPSDCTGPADVTSSTKSKCNAGTTSVSGIYVNGSVTVTKETLPSGDTQEFAFTATATSTASGDITLSSEDSSFSLADSNSHIVSMPINSETSTLTIIEAETSNWDPTVTLSCTKPDGSSADFVTIDNATRTITATLSNTNPNAVCTITNTQLISPALSTVTADLSEVPADGTSASTITVTLRDGAGELVVGKTVSLSVDTGSSDITLVTNENGVATFTVTNTVAEGPITYTADADGITITPSVQVEFMSTSCTLGSFKIGVPTENTLSCSGNSAVIDITATCVDGVTTKNDYVGNVNISTSSNHGDWNKITATNTPVNGVADYGTATHLFDLADNGHVQLGLSNQHADDLTVTVSDGVSSTSSSFSFRDNVFIITPTTENGSPLSTTEVVVGRDHVFQIELWTKDPDTANCEKATNYNEDTNNIYAWYTPDAAHPAGAVAPTLNDFALTTAPEKTSITFTNGVATPPALRTTDVGKYVLNIKDASGFAVDPDGTPLVIEGSSATLTVRPFGFNLDFTNARFDDWADNGVLDGSADDTSYAANADGSAFITAGADFAMNITAIQWQAGDDTDNNGIPDSGANLTDNPAAVNFGQETPPPSLTFGYTLNGVTNGGNLDVSNSASSGTTDIGHLLTLPFTNAEFTNGSTAPTLNWDEVGIIDLSVNLADYLGTSGVNITGNAINVGRFYPDHFDVVVVHTPTITDLAQWLPSTTYGSGEVVIPTIPNSHYYMATTPGDSDLTEPVFWPTNGSSITDGTTVTWSDLGTTLTTSDWQTSTAYTAGTIREPVLHNGHIYIASQAGTTGASEPIWPTDGSAVTDGSVIWRDLGARLLTNTYTDFSYLDQPFTFNANVSLTIEAKNRNNDTTKNYGGDGTADYFWKLPAPTILAANYVDNFTGSTSLIVDNPGTATYSSIADYDGKGTLVLDAAFRYPRPIFPLTQAPFSPNFDFSVVIEDSDGVCYDVTPFDTCNNPFVIEAITGGNLRHGRLEILNNFGPETETLGIPLTAQYYNGTTFLTNTLDASTTATLGFSNFIPKLDSGETCVLSKVTLSDPEVSGEDCAAVAPPSKRFNQPPSSGDFNLNLQAPGLTNDGSVTITVTSDNWLQFDWDGDDNYDNDATATATFGIYRGNDRIINWREIVR
jgi:hypothetical protein